LFGDLDELTTVKNTTQSTTKLTLIQQLLEESKNILPLTAKRSPHPSTLQSTLQSTIKLTTLLKTTPKKTTKSTTPLETTQTTPITSTIKSTTKKMKPNVAIPQTTTSTKPSTLLTTRQYKNEEERLLELLMNPRRGSKIEIVGKDDVDENNNPPELIMFEIAVSGTPPPFVPTFHPPPNLDPPTAPTETPESPSGNGTDCSPCPGQQYPNPYFPDQGISPYYPG
jgi:hypothetical protein